MHRRPTVRSKSPCGSTWDARTCGDFLCRRQPAPASAFQVGDEFPNLPRHDRRYTFKTPATARDGRVEPLAVFLDEVDEALDGFAFGDVEFHGGLADVEVDLAGRAADVAEIGVGHFAGAVDDAAHDGDLDALEVVGRFADFGGGGLQIEEGAAAGGTGDVVGLEDAVADRLQDVEREADAGAGAGLAADEDGVADAVAEQRADVGGGAEHGVEDVGLGAGRGRVEGVLEQDGVLRGNLRGEIAEGDDGRERAAVGDGDEVRRRARWRGNRAPCRRADRLR